MTANVLLNAFAAVVVAAIAGPLGSFVAAMLGRLTGGERTVAMKFRSGKQVRLDLDKRLDPEEMNRLIVRAAKSVEAGDEKALQTIIAESHAASVRAREAAR